jgi:hypothetical protein
MATKIVFLQYLHFYVFVSLVLFGSVGAAGRCHGAVQTEEIRALLGGQDAAAECSIFEAAYLNATQIRTGDVLVTYSHTYDTVAARGEDKKLTGVFESKVKTSRYVFDLDQKRFLVIVREGPSRRIDMAVENADSQEVTSTPTGWILDYPNEKILVHTRKEPFPWRIAQGKSLSETLGMFQYVDPRIAIFPPRATLVEEKAGSISVLASGKHFVRSEMIGENIRRLHFRRSNNDKIRWDFDVENSLPIEFDSEAWHPGDAKYYPDRKRSIRWDTVDDYPVVTSVRWDDFTDFPSLDGNEYYGFIDYEVRYHWFSVNQKIAPEYFDGSVFESPERMSELLSIKKDDDERHHDDQSRPNEKRSVRDKIK